MKLVKQLLGKVAITVEKNYWSSDKTYDRLVIVEVAGVGCYISRKPVPSGTQYDNRDYWIRLSVLSNEGSSTNIVTEFGDSVDLAIAQKTITDRFQEVYDDTHFQDTFAPHVNLPIVAGYWHLKELITSLNDTLSEQIGDLSNSVTDISTNLDNVIENVNNIVNNALNQFITSVDNLNRGIFSFRSIKYKLKNDEKVYYLGSNLTTSAKSNYYSYYLATLLGFANTHDNQFHFDKTILSLSAIKQFLTRERSDSTTFAKHRAIILQFDDYTIDLGTESDIPSYGDDTPSDTLYGVLISEIDKIHIDNPDCQVFIIAPPRPVDNEYLNNKINVLKHICELTGSTFINPDNVCMSIRYPEMFILPSETIGSISQIDVTKIADDFVSRWLGFVTHEINYNFMNYGYYK